LLYCFQKATKGRAEMKAFEIMTDIIGKDFTENNKSWTVDKIKLGDENCEVDKIGVCMTASPDVIRRAAEWGCQLLITHEPIFYDHVDNYDESNPYSKAKKELLENAGITLYRYHDAMHLDGPDMVSLAFLQYLGWEGDFDGEFIFRFAKPKDLREAVEEVKEKIGITHPRIVGSRDGMISKVYLLLGHRGGDSYLNFATDDEAQLAFGGELCEWHDAEPTRDAAQLGKQKTLVILGHAGSERFAMEALTAKINKKYDNAEARYFDCGELYTYFD